MTIDCKIIGHNVTFLFNRFQNKLRCYPNFFALYSNKCSLKILSYLLKKIVVSLENIWVIPIKFAVFSKNRNNTLVDDTSNFDGQYRKLCQTIPQFFWKNAANSERKIPQTLFGKFLGGGIDEPNKLCIMDLFSNN